MRNFSNSSKSGWQRAIIISESYLIKPVKVDKLIAGHYSDLSVIERRRCHYLLFGMLRNLRLIEFALSKLLSKEPRPLLKSILFIGATEILLADSSLVPKIIHHAVKQAKYCVSLKESGMVNAVLRKFPAVIRATQASEIDTIEHLSLLNSHPEWLVRRWEIQFGLNKTKHLLNWNQRPSPVYVRITESENRELEGSLSPTNWPDFFLVKNDQWAPIEDLVNAGRAYVMDPASRLPTALLDVQPHETVLDLCASPGGKSILLGEQLSGNGGQLVCLDLPGPRLDLLKKNLVESRDIRCDFIGADLLETTPDDLRSWGMPNSYDAVLIDAPCSNTGVLRRRPDAKWRLCIDDIKSAADEQLKMLECASAFVRSGGRLVYSTCSIEREENEDLISRFLSQYSNTWCLMKKAISHPWNNNHDGGAAFLLKKDATFPLG